MTVDLEISLSTILPKAVEFNL